MDLYEEIRRERDPKSDAAWKTRNSWWSTPCAEVKPEAIIPEIRRRWMPQGKIDALLAEGALIEARLVATRLGRNFIGIELNPDYCEMARNRIVNDAPLFNSVLTEPAPHG